MGTESQIKTTLTQKIADQYGMGVKDALLLIIETFDRFGIYKNILNGRMSDTKDKNNIISKTKSEYREIINAFNTKYNLPSDQEIDDQIIDLLCRDHKYLNNYRVIMSDDMENCFNMIWRAPSLLNI